MALWAWRFTGASASYRASDIDSEAGRPALRAVPRWAGPNERAAFERGAARHHQGNREPISIASLFKMGADRLAKPVAKGFLAARASWLAKG